MEWIWYIIASIGAGIGTGLAGLSAATVMVPILIVLCPSFQGETGAYQATAIALASDILGSAVTTYTYAKHKNIDLKRGWIMLVCILVMCTAGCYAAYLADNVVLGSFTLFLTFFIGIRFLVKPDTSRENTAAKGEKLDWKGVIISLFFGLTIGFGTGFVGTGGGMMMLVVFTVFLGMELRTAVGTSTFIMTFTALIASISHILIHPAILLEKWDVMLVCMIIATAASLLSARFANRLSSRTVGLVTGGVLTLLGGVMLGVYFRDIIFQYELVRQMFRCTGLLVMYIIPCLMVLVPVRFFTKVPSFVFRKMLHMVAITCVVMMILSAGSWQAAALTSLLIAAVVCPLLAVLENEPWYARLLVQKSSGEIKKSLLMLSLTFAVLITVTWGIFKRPQLAACAVQMWGIGDAMAALIGVPFGKHKVQLRLADGKKSWEGTAAMFVSAFLVGLGMLVLVQQFSFGKGFLCAAAAAAAGAMTELFTSSEYDTVSVPLVAAAILLLMERII